ncbi:MAG: dynamin family protein [Ruminococcus sp.]|nr:dynamin family protein [Ruminococcus sp.]
MSFRTDSVNNFVSAMLDSEEKFSQGIKAYEDKQAQIEQIFSDMEKQINNLVRNSANPEDSMNIASLKKNVTSVLNECIKTGTAKILESGKGMSFIKGHEKTFVVSVFGKVKSGKSSLGNFIMGSEIKKLGISSEYDKIKPVVTVEDRGKITTSNKLETLSEEDCEFGVGSTETTSTIQYFTIGGLSWFDTPGIGSITKENEELAKEYIQNSDLVIFTCSSDAAGTQQEFLEMKRFAEMKKPVLLLVTMSDTYDEDCDDDGNIIKVLMAKSDKDRKDVEDYLLDSIREQNLDDILQYSSIMTISKQLAVEAFRNGDDEQYRQSNIDKFLDKLIEITKNDAGQMKLATPMKRINTMITDVIGNENTESLMGLKKTLNENISDFNRQIQELDTKKESIRTMIKSDSMAKIQNLISRYRTEIGDGGKSISSGRISGDIVKIISESSRTICERELSEFMTSNSTRIFDNMQENGFSIPEMKMQTESISYQQQFVERRSRPPHGLFEHIGSFFGKEYYENHTRTVTKHHNINTGVNESAIRDAITSQINVYFQDNVEVQINELIDMYFRPVVNLNQEAVKLIDTAVSRLSAMKG